MSNVTKCADKSCPSRKSCYRYTCPAGQWQSFAAFNREDGAEKCQDFIAAEPGTPLAVTVLRTAKNTEPGKAAVS